MYMKPSISFIFKKIRMVDSKQHEFWRKFEEAIYISSRRESVCPMFRFLTSNSFRLNYHPHPEIYKFSVKEKISSVRRKSSDSISKIFTEIRRLIYLRLYVLVFLSLILSPFYPEDEQKIFGSDFWFWFHSTI